MIRLNNITKRYKHHVALDNVSLHVPKGIIYGVIGESGAGKSTLVRCINLLEAPDSGQVIVDNKNITELKSNTLRQSRRKIGMIFQHFNLLNSRTVYGNIAFPLELIGWSKAKIEITVQPLIKLTGLENKVSQFPSQLSGGQKQRVAIARALASEPDILLCDEATSALDPNTTKSILNLLKDINKRTGITIVLITHEMDVARTICDHVAVMAKGKVIENNSVEQIFLNPQQPITQQFVHSVTQTKQITEDQSKEYQYPLLHITFVDQVASEPLITMTARQFSVDFNILHGDIEMINDKNMGFLLVKLIGEKHNTSKALEFLLQNNNINVEVISHGK